MIGKFPALAAAFFAVALVVAGCSQLHPHTRALHRYGIQVDPQTYTSPSGHYTLWINPSKPNGVGSAYYRLSKDGQPVWSKDLDLTLTTAAVDDAGRAGGFADSRVVDDEGYFEVQLIASDGRILLDDRHPLVPTMVVDGSPNPQGLGVIMDDSNNRMIVRIWPDYGDDRGEAWWGYSLSNGKFIGESHPNADQLKALGLSTKATPNPSLPSQPKFSSKAIRLDLVRKWAVPRASEIGDLVVAPAGEIDVLDRKSATVKYYDASGKLTHVSPRLVLTDTAWIQVTRSGDVFVGLGMDDLHLSPSGKRIDRQHLVRNTLPPTIPTPKPTWRWVTDLLADENGNVVGELRRWPDQAWMLDGPSAVAPDGSLMSIGAMGGRSYGREPDRIAFFSPNGTPEGQFSIPSGLGKVEATAYDGRLAYVICDIGVVAFDRQGKPAWRFKLPANLTDRCEIFPSRGGIALWDGKQTVSWYKTP